MTFNVTTGAKVNPDILSEDTIQTGPSPSIKLVDDTASEKDFLIKLDADKVNMRDDAGADGDFLVLDLVNSRVGIGTTTPADKIHVVGTPGDVSSNIANGNLFILDGGTITSADIGVGIRFARTGSQLGFIVGARENASDEAGYLAFATQAANGTHPEHIRITSTGNVGMGTTSPASPLHIVANTPGTVGSDPAGQLIIQDPDDNVNGNAVITGYESDVSGNPDQQLWYLGSSSGSNEAITFLNRRNDSLSLGTNGSTRLSIDAEGLVGIGTVSPDHKLHVETAGDPAIFKSTSGNGRIAIDAPSTMNSGIKLFEAGVLQWQLINQGTDDTFKIQNAGFSTKFFIQQDGDVGIGTTSPNSILSFKMGNGTGVADASGRANVNTTVVGNVGAGEDDLMTYSLPADSLSTDGKSIRITAWGTIDTSNSKTIRLKFGSTIIQQIGATTSGGLDWKIEGLVIRTGAATQKAIGTQLLDTFAQDSTNTSPTETLSGVVVIKVTGEGVANDDVKQEGMLVEYLN